MRVTGAHCLLRPPSFRVKGDFTEVVLSVTWSFAPLMFNSCLLTVSCTGVKAGQGFGCWDQRTILFQTEGRADCRLEEGRAGGGGGFYLIHCCVPTPGMKVVLVNIGGGGKGDRDKLGVSRALEMQEGMRSEEAGASESPGGFVKPQIVGPPP